MWRWNTEQLEPDRCERYTLVEQGRPVSYGAVLELWRSDRAFRGSFAEVLADSRFAAYRWESPALTTAKLNQPFEFVLLRCDALARPVDTASFAELFGTAAEGSTIVTFANLSGDAVLVVPCPLGPSSAYGHLAAFVRQAPREQVDQLWQAVAEAMSQKLGERPVWLSTAGLGVAWLHVRLDARPKYYGYHPYTR